MGYYDGIIEEAAAMLESLAMNHPFVDGNKRTAFYATLLMHSCARTVTSSTATTMRHTRSSCGCSQTNSFRFAELKVWLDEHVKPLPGS